MCCVSLVPGFVCVASFVRNSLLNNASLCGCTTFSVVISWWTFGFSVMNYGAMTISVQVSVDTCSHVSLSYIHGSVIAGHIVAVFLILPGCFTTQLHHCTSVLLHVLVSTYYLFDYSHPSGFDLHFYWLKMCIFFPVLIGHLYIFFGECLFNSSLIFKLGCLYY